MIGYGRVVGGDYLNGTVSTPIGSTLVVQAGFKRKKLVPETVAEWDEVVTDSKGNVVSSVGKAVASAVIPGKFGKAAAAAVGATIDSIGSVRVIDVSWDDGKRSLIKLPESMFKHLELVLRAQRAERPDTASSDQLAVVEEDKPTVTEQAFSFASGMIRDYLPPRSKSSTNDETPPSEPVDVMEQLTKLAALRDAGVLTEEEFAGKKAELLARL